MPFRTWYLNSRLVSNPWDGRCGEPLEDHEAPAQRPDVIRIIKNVLTLEPVFPIKPIGIAVSDGVRRTLDPIVRAAWSSVEFSHPYMLPHSGERPDPKIQARYPYQESRREMRVQMMRLAVDHAAPAPQTRYWLLHPSRSIDLKHLYDDWEWLGGNEPAGHARLWAPEFSRRAVHALGVVYSSGYFFSEHAWCILEPTINLDLFWVRDVDSR